MRPTPIPSSETHAAPAARPAGPRVASAETERRRLRRELTLAVERGGFSLHYQPRLSLRTGRQVGAEALLRWPVGPRGMISPSTFLPLANEAGLGLQTGAWVLDAACRAAAAWAQEGMICVNIAASQISEHALARQVATALADSGLAPERLELELPEEALLDLDEDSVLDLSALRDIGVGLSLDNFGAGVASLSMLRRLPLSGLKLDRSLIRNLPDEREDAAMVHATIQLAHMLGLTVTANGVETEAQRSFLVAAGCDDGQGHLFSMPLPGERLKQRTRA